MTAAFDSCEVDFESQSPPCCRPQNFSGSPLAGHGEAETLPMRKCSSVTDLKPATSAANSWAWPSLN